MTEGSAQTRSPHFAEAATAATYSQIHLPRVFTPWARILMDVVPVRPGETVLDVATGPGTVAREAATRVGPAGRVVGVDMSAAMLGVARGWPKALDAAPIEYVESSATAMPLTDGTFDVAYCQQGLQHMADAGAALREIRRLLKVGGRLGVATWQQSPFGLFREAMDRLGAGSPEAQPTSFGRDAAELRQALLEAGFEDVAIQTRELTSVLEGGIPQALEGAAATSAGSGLRDGPPERQQAAREAIAAALQPYLRDGAVVLPSVAHLAAAVRRH